MITIEEAKRKIEVLEQLKNNPKLIFTDLFSEGVEGLIFLQQISIDEKSVSNLVKKCIQSFAPFKDCIIKNNGQNVTVQVRTIRPESDYTILGYDDFMEINLEKKQYYICDRWLKRYEEIINATYVYNPKVLPDIYKQFESKSLSEHFHDVINGDTTLREKIRWLTRTSKKKKEIRQKIAFEKEHIKYTNAFMKSNYEHNVSKQAFYKKSAPAHIEMIKQKQNEIVTFLQELEYVENEGEKYDD